MQQLQRRSDVLGLENALSTIKMIKDQISQCCFQSLLNFRRTDYSTFMKERT